MKRKGLGEKCRAVSPLGMASAFAALALVLLVSSVSLAAQTASYSPTWESIDARPTPAWFTDAKFGVFICMGLSSVPAWSPKGNYSEWYEYWVKERSFDGAVADFHARNYGPGFEFKDFAPMFRLELWNPDEWADLVARSGAKYIVFTAKHHCGYTLWPNAQAEKAYGENYNPLKVGPKRDVVGEVVAAFRKKAIRSRCGYTFRMTNVSDQGSKERKRP